MKDWDPNLYLKFNKERIQPSIDLVSRIEIENPANIIDIGCGPGNSTQILSLRWPQCRITGIDNSIAMIEKAKVDYPYQDWQLLDAGKDDISGKFDIIFSNATIQWIPDHYNLLKKFKNNLSDKGLIAVGVPQFFDMPLGKSIAKISREEKWSDQLEGVNNLFTMHQYIEYYDILSELFNSIHIWETYYIHVMNSHESVLEMVRSSGLRPYINRLECDSDKKIFEKKVLSEIKVEYPLQENGKVLFPFKRLFFIAGK